MFKRFDLVISGASYTGMALALALTKGLEGGARIALIGNLPGGADGRPHESPRAFAVSAGSRHLLDYLDVWSQIEPFAQPVTEIEITDSPLEAGIRPVLLTYDNRVEDDHEPASYIVPDATLAQALVTSLRSTPDVRVFHGVNATDFTVDADAASLSLSDGSTISADLVVAAEGRKSQVRDRAGIKTIGWDYHQVGICTTVGHQKPHHGRAVQHFLPAGPFAILPLQNSCSCITWTEEKKKARRILDLDEEGFLAEVERRFSGRLGELELKASPASWPLSMHLARSFVAPRLALIGDTAHSVHPIAGQGLNLGLRDVGALSEIIVDNARIGLPASDPSGLKRYERWRRFDSTMSAATFDGLNRLFSNDNPFLRSLREAGLGLIDRIPLVKENLVKEAAGLTGDVPRLLRGEDL